MNATLNDPRSEPLAKAGLQYFDDEATYPEAHL
jgi:hypothetical protein